MATPKDERTSRDGVLLVRKHLWLAKDDVQTIEALWGKQIGMSKFVRTVLADYIRALRAKAAAKGKALDVQKEGDADDKDDMQGIAPGGTTSTPGVG